MGTYSYKQEELIIQLVEIIPIIRKELDISQSELGFNVGLSRQMISLIERGGSDLSWNNYLAIMMFFKIKEESGSYIVKNFKELYEKTIDCFKNNQITKNIYIWEIVL